jgi:hypothetical protein
MVMVSPAANVTDALFWFGWTIDTRKKLPLYGLPARPTFRIKAASRSAFTLFGAWQCRRAVWLHLLRCADYAISSSARAANFS